MDGCLMKRLNQHEETIIAQCTPQGKGALALLRISGVDAWKIADSFARLANKKRLDECPTHTIQFGEVIDSTGKAIDQVLFLLMRGPRTFTGQDTVEITCHNNPFIIDAIIKITIQAGARMAEHGEFSRRAVANGKIDLLQAEAINELIQAQTSIALKQSLSQVQGSLSSWLISLEQSLLKAYAFCEASFEFVDDEMEFGSDIKTIIQSMMAAIETLEKTFDQQQHIREGIRIAIIGSVNAGKSSLFNALLTKERAIVTPIPGTTRDTIEAGMYKEGNYWTLIDTAGLRQTADIIEHQGIERSYQEAEQADVIVLVADFSRAMTDQERTIYNELIKLHGKKIIFVRNKADLPAVASIDTAPTVSCSCTTQENINLVHDAITQKIEQLMATLDVPFLLNQRQFNLILSLKKELREIDTMLQGVVQYELLAVHLKDALTLLSTLTGKSVTEQMLDEIFKQFCVGK